MSVGAFPGFAALNKMTHRAPVNPLDKSTVVSIYPRDIHERKPTIQPGEFKLAKGSLQHPSILVVGPSSWWREVDEHQPLLEIPVSSMQVADSIVKDYCNGILGSNMGESMPGLFWVPGEFTLEQLTKQHDALLKSAAVKQRMFYQTVVKLADSLWARTNGNPLVISEDMRLAARELGLQKDWTRDFQQIESVRCKACGSLKNPQFPVCPTCKAIDDPDAAKKLGIVFAQ